jgi:hypothetical protein
MRNFQRGGTMFRLMPSVSTIAMLLSFCHRHGRDFAARRALLEIYVDDAPDASAAKVDYR